MSFEDILALASKELKLLEQEEELNLCQYKIDHPDEFPIEERISYEQRTGEVFKGLTFAQKSRLARKNKRYRERMKEIRELERKASNLQPKDYDKRIRTIKIYKIKTSQS